MKKNVGEADVRICENLSLAEDAKSSTIEKGNFHPCRAYILIINNMVTTNLE